MIEIFTRPGLYTRRSGNKFDHGSNYRCFLSDPHHFGCWLVEIILPRYSSRALSIRKSLGSGWAPPWSIVAWSGERRAVSRSKPPFQYGGT
jgi:hypothetical protein